MSFSNDPHRRRPKGLPRYVPDEAHNQFQIGDEVWYVPEGVHATVTEYVWGQELPPKILLYKLSCGISVAKAHLRRWIPAREL